MDGPLYHTATDRDRGSVAAQTGFKGIWGSGLSISAAMGVRDNNEASWTQVLEVLEVRETHAGARFVGSGSGAQQPTTHRRSS